MLNTGYILNLEADIRSIKKNKNGKECLKIFIYLLMINIMI